MNVKQKLGYMFIGCLFTIAGYILASLGGDTTHAQQNEQVIDKIVCRELEVVNTAGNVVASIASSDNGGIMSVQNTAGKVVAGIAVTEHDSGIMSVQNTAGKVVAFISATDKGGGMSIQNTAGKNIVAISATKDGGFMGVQNTAGKNVIRFGVTEKGNGGIQTYKDGWRIH